MRTTNNEHHVRLRSVVQLLGRNRLAKFEYFPGDAAATRASEEILITTVAKDTSIHSGGWCGFKPSDYGSNVRDDTTGVLCSVVSEYERIHDLNFLLATTKCPNRCSAEIRHTRART